MVRESMTGVPLWAVFGLMTAFFSAALMLIQERLKAPGFAMAFWVKVCCVVLVAPLAFHAGFPANPNFYILIAVQAMLWVVSDVIFYRSVGEIEAGVVARILPVAAVASFLLWFAFDWKLASAYIAKPWHSAAILTVFCLLTFFAMRLKDCEFTMKALRSVWFIVVAAILGSIASKLVTQQAQQEQGAYAFVFCEALVMLAAWSVYYALRRPLPVAVMFGWSTIRAGMIAGAVATCMFLTTVYAYYNVDNPAYVPAMRYLDSVLILLFYRLTGKPRRGHVWAGLGVVGCAAALIILKAHG